MREITVNNWNELVDAITIITIENKCRMWFRGQADIKWGLLPTVKRKPYNIGEKEQYLANDFYIEIKRRMPNVPEKRSGQISLMQHYGLPTRLLDWSESPLVALYFATSNWSEYPESDAAIWVLVPNRLNVLQGFGDYLYPMDKNAVLQLIEGAFKDKEEENKVIACCGVESDLRMYVQQANFTVHDSEIPLEKFDKAEEFLVKLKIPAKNKQIMFEQLELLGFRESTIFPDMEHISHELKEMFK